MAGTEKHTKTVGEHRAWSAPPGACAAGRSEITAIVASASLPPNLGIHDSGQRVAARLLLLGLPGDVLDFLAIHLEVDVGERALTRGRVRGAVAGLVLQHEVGLRLVLVLLRLDLVVHRHALASLLADDVHVVRVVLLAVGDAAADGVSRLHRIAVLRRVPRLVRPVEARVEDRVHVSLVAPRQNRLHEGAVAVLRLDAEPPTRGVRTVQRFRLRWNIPRGVERRDAAVLRVGVGHVAQPPGRRVVREHDAARGCTGSSEGREASGCSGDEELHSQIRLQSERVNERASEVAKERVRREESPEKKKKKKKQKNKNKPCGAKRTKAELKHSQRVT